MSKAIKPEIGKEYLVNHSRKGNFNMKVTEIRGEWIDGVITTGTAGAILRENVKYEGEEITVRDCLATFHPLPKK